MPEPFNSPAEFHRGKINSFGTIQRSAIGGDVQRGTIEAVGGTMIFSGVVKNAAPSPRRPATGADVLGFLPPPVSSTSPAAPSATTISCPSTP
jgi:hypothetical protein